ncbi:hypothetical protein NEF87_002368 [Candidatus Lokiarchaeum ossiferum]|uniref:Nucleotidyltransferase n=1 Tax=Candidatus Lokiarchaeum ossiferum TaxID=2951803 RepID=A0ABY6HRV8_9ARCH|nr:hypothetical protein NEF87_002368 [Candidatus Lokiarchaeum sp. B-35]
MTLHDKKKMEESLQPFLEQSLNLPENILKIIDFFFETMQAIFHKASQLYPMLEESAFDLPTFNTILENVNDLEIHFKKLHHLDKDHVSFFQTLNQLLEDPTNKMEKIRYLSKLGSGFSLTGSHDHVSDSDFEVGYFYKLSYNTLSKPITDLESLKPFMQTPKSSEQHHPCTTWIHKFIQDLAQIMLNGLGEIIPGVVYYEFPPSIMHYHQRSQEIAQIFDLPLFINPENKVSKYLQLVIREFNKILDENRYREKKIKMNGILSDKPGLYEFRRVIKSIKKFQTKFEKLGFLN